MLVEQFPAQHGSKFQYFIWFMYQVCNSNSSEQTEHLGVVLTFP